MIIFNNIAEINRIQSANSTLFLTPISDTTTTANRMQERLLKRGKDLNSKIVKDESFYAINYNELVLLLEKANQEIIDMVISSKQKKVIALDKLLKGNDQLKTNTVLQMRDAGIEFKTIQDLRFWI